MDHNTEENIRAIYINHCEQVVLDKFISHLDSFWNINKSALLPIKTIGANGKLLNYFSVFHISHPGDMVLLAGAVDADSDGVYFPIIRLDPHNPSIALVAPFTFPYSKKEQRSNTVNVKLLPETIESVPVLFDSQLAWFTRHYAS